MSSAIFVAVFLSLLVFSVDRTNAAVTGTSTPMTSNQSNTLKDNYAGPVMKVDLSADAGETLSSVAINIASATSATPTALTASSFGEFMLMKDANANGIMDGGDTFIASSTANLGSTSTIDVASATTTPATGTFFVVLGTASSSLWTDNGYPENPAAVPQKFTVSIASDGIVASSTSPVLNATTTPIFTADVHSQAPDTSKIVNSFSNPNYIISDNAGAGGVDEAGNIYVYDTSTSTSPFANGMVNSAGQMSINLGTQQRSSVWLEAKDIANNATSTRVQYNFSGLPTVTSINAYTDRIIVNISSNLNGQDAMNCSHYTVNGSPLACGGFNAPFIEFFGNKIVLHNLSLTLGSTASLAISNVATLSGPLFNYTNNSLTVQQAIIPAITALSASSGKAGDSITITGSNFGSATGTVMFSGGFSQQTGPMPPVSASTTAWSATSITATVPAGAQAGPVQVVASDGTMSDMNESTFFDIVGPLYVQVILQNGVSTSTVNDPTNIRIFIGNKEGTETYYKSGDAGVSYDATTTVYTINDISSTGFMWAYDASGARLQSMGMQVQPNTSSTVPQVLTLTGTTTRKVSGTITLGGTGGSCTAAGQNKNVALMAFAQTSGTSTDMGQVMPAFFTTDGTCQVSYNVPLSGNGTYNIEAHLPPSQTATPLMDPSPQTVVITDSTTTATVNFTFSAAARKIYGRVVDGSGNALSSSTYSDLWVWAYQPIVNGKSSGSVPNGTGYFTLYVDNGSYKIGVGGKGMPSGTEQDLVVDSSAAFDLTATSTALTIKLSPPTTSISGFVKDGTGNAVASVDINAWCQGGPGGGHAQTDSQGFYTISVPPCSNYHVNGFSQTYGQLTEQTNISVSNGNSPTVNFTVSSSDLASITGTVSQNSSPLSQADVWITQGTFGPPLGWGKTQSNGSFNVAIRKGSSNLYLHVAIMGQGEIITQQLNSGSAVNADIALGALAASVATIEIDLKPMNTFSSVFIGAHNGNNGGFTNTKVGTGADYDIYNIQVPYSGPTSYTIDGGIPGFGPIPSQTVSVNGNTSVVIDLGSVSFYTVSGTVSGNYTDASVWAGGPNGGGMTKVNNNDGSFSMQLRQGIYDIGVNKPGYYGTMLGQQNISTTTAGLSLTLTQASSTITGTAAYNGTPIQNIRVWADNNSGAWSGDTTNAAGAFTLNVAPGTYTVHAIGDGYQSSPILVTAPASGLNIALSQVVFNPKQQSQTLNSTQGGVVQSDDAKVEVPQGAFTGATGNMQVSITDTMNAPDKKGAKVIGTAKTLTATYASNGQNYTGNFGQDVDLEMVLTKAQLVSDGISSISDVQKMVIGYDNGSSWDSLPTTVILNPTGATWDTLVSVTLKAATSHFSTYAPVLPTSGSAPATPTGLSAATNTSQVTLSWNTVSGATKYDIYRQSGSDYAYLAQTTSLSYTDTGLTNGTTYYYKVSALDDSGNESAATAAISATPSTPVVTGGGGACISCISGGNSGSSGGSSSGNVSSTATTSSTAATTSSTTTTTPSGIENALSVVSSNPASQTAQNVITQIAGQLTRTLKYKSRNKDVTTLQEFLAQYPDIYPEGITSGYFGVATRKAVERFQEKYGIALPGDLGYGIVGPATRAKINSLINSAQNGISNLAQNISSGQVQTIQEIKAKIQELQQQLVALLQQLLSQLKTQ